MPRFILIDLLFCSPRGSFLRCHSREVFIAVTPAKAGAQGLNIKAALWAAFHFVPLREGYGEG